MKTFWIAIILFSSTQWTAGENTAVESNTTKRWKCDDAEKDNVDNLAERILFHEKDDRFPENKEELIQYCKKQLTSINQLDDYREQCMKGKPKQIISMVTYSTRAWNNLYCRNPDSKHSKKLFNSAPCANEASAGYRKCNNNYVNHLRMVHNSSQSHDNHVAQMCCGYIKIFECMREVATPLKSCNEKHIEYNEKYIRNLFDHVVQVVCGEYNEETGKCDKILKRKRIKVTAAGTDSDQLKSFFGMVVEILTKQ